MRHVWTVPKAGLTKWNLPGVGVRDATTSKNGKKKKKKKKEKRKHFVILVKERAVRMIDRTIILHRNSEESEFYGSAENNRRVIEHVAIFKS